jgi:thioredoxin 1
MVAPTIEEVSTEMSDVAKVGKVNVDEEQELAQAFGVRSIPTLVVVKNGKVVQTQVGVKSKRDIISMIG